MLSESCGKPELATLKHPTQLQSPIILTCGCFNILLNHTDSGANVRRGRSTWLASHLFWHGAHDLAMRRKLNPAGGFWKCWSILENKTRQGFAPPSWGLRVASRSHEWSCRELGWKGKVQSASEKLAAGPDVRRPPNEATSPYRPQTGHVAKGHFLTVEVLFCWVVSTSHPIIS